MYARFWQPNDAAVGGGSENVWLGQYPIMDSSSYDQLMSAVPADVFGSRLWKAGPHRALGSDPSSAGCSSVSTSAPMGESFPPSPAVGMSAYPPMIMDASVGWSGFFGVAMPPMAMSMSMSTSTPTPTPSPVSSSAEGGWTRFDPVVGHQQMRHMQASPSQAPLMLHPVAPTAAQYVTNLFGGPAPNPAPAPSCLNPPSPIKGATMLSEADLAGMTSESTQHFSTPYGHLPDFQHHNINNNFIPGSAQPSSLENRDDEPVERRVDESDVEEDSDDADFDYDGDDEENSNSCDDDGENNNNNNNNNDTTASAMKKAGEKDEKMSRTVGVGRDGRISEELPLVNPCLAGEKELFIKPEATFDETEPVVKPELVFESMERLIPELVSKPVPPWEDMVTLGREPVSEETRSAQRTEPICDQVSAKSQEPVLSAEPTTKGRSGKGQKPVLEETGSAPQPEPTCSQVSANSREPVFRETQPVSRPELVSKARPSRIQEPVSKQAELHPAVGEVTAMSPDGTLSDSCLPGKCYKPNCAETEPVSRLDPAWEDEPVTGREPTSKEKGTETKPVHPEPTVEEVQESVEPVSKETEPVLEGTQQVSKETEPVSKETEPVLDFEGTSAGDKTSVFIPEPLVVEQEPVSEPVPEINTENLLLLARWAEHESSLITFTARLAALSPSRPSVSETGLHRTPWSTLVLVASHLHEQLLERKHPPSPVPIAREHRSPVSAAKVRSFIERKARQYKAILGSVERPPSPIPPLSCSSPDRLSAEEHALFAPLYTGLRAAMTEICDRLKDLSAEAQRNKRRRTPSQQQSPKVHRKKNEYVKRRKRRTGSFSSVNSERVASGKRLPHPQHQPVPVLEEEEEEDQEEVSEGHKDAVLYKVADQPQAGDGLGRLIDDRERSRSPSPPVARERRKFKPKLKAEAKVKDATCVETSTKTQSKKAPSKSLGSRPVPGGEAWTKIDDSAPPDSENRQPVDPTPSVAKEENLFSSTEKCDDFGLTRKLEQIKEEAKPVPKPKVEHESVDPETSRSKPVAERPRISESMLKSTGLMSVLVAENGLFSSAILEPVQFPEVFGLTLVGDRRSRRRFLSRMEVLNELLLEVKPTRESLRKGTRIAAKWSAKFRELYPGTVTDAATDDADVEILFDDGDTGVRRLDDVRLLPRDYPVVVRDPDPIMSSARKRRRTDSDGAGASGVENVSVVTNNVEDVSTTTTKKPKKTTTPTQKAPRRCQDNATTTTTKDSTNGWQWIDDFGGVADVVVCGGKKRKLHRSGIRRGDEVLRIGDCAVFASGVATSSGVSSGRNNSYIGRITQFWQTTGKVEMGVRVSWFYRPEEAKGLRKTIPKRGLFSSSHVDDNDVQSIVEKCRVISFKEFLSMRGRGSGPVPRDLYYCAGGYDPVAERATLISELQ